MDKETLSNYGWIVIAVLVLSVMIALATPFGKYIEQGVKNTTEGLFTTSQKAFNNMGLNAVLPDQEFDGTYEKPSTDSSNGDNDSTSDALNHNGTIPEGGTYITHGIEIFEILTAGSNFPATVTMGDSYEYGGYKYRYNQRYTGSSWCDYPEQNGWGVSINTADKTQTSYGAILESINGMPITAISSGAFNGCTSLTNIDLPDSVTTIGVCAFYGCTSLTNIDLPDSVTTIDVSAFDGCTSLESIVIPDGVTTIKLTAFAGCTSLESIVIPDSVTTIEFYAFYECTSLTNITFEGTKAQWNAITFEDAWNDYCPEITVTCTDGTITV